MAGHWILVVTKPQQEDWAAANIHQMGYEVYLPKCWTRRIVNARAIRVLRPLFPRYLFVRTAGPWRFLLGTWGVASVVMFSDEPEPVRDAVVAALKARAGPDGHVALAEPPVAEPFERGAVVSIKAGPFAALEGIYAGMTGGARNKVLLDLLGRKTVVETSTGNLQAAR